MPRGQQTWGVFTRIRAVTPVRSGEEYDFFVVVESPRKTIRVTAYELNDYPTFCAEVLRQTGRPFVCRDVEFDRATWPEVYRPAFCYEGEVA